MPAQARSREEKAAASLRALEANSILSPAFTALRQPDLPRPSPATSSQQAAASMDNAIRLSSEATLATVKDMMAANTAQLMAQLGPMFQSLHSNQQASRASEDERREHERRAEEATRSTEEHKAASDLHRALENSREQARVDSILPPTALHPEVEARPRGGAQRVGPRMELARRLMQGTGDLSAADVEHFNEVLLRGHQVSPPPISRTLPAARASVPPLSTWGVETAGQASRAAPALFGHLQQHGLAPPAPSEVLMRSMMSVFKAAGDKEAKKAADLTSFSEFVAFMGKAKVLTREYHDTDPDAYWAMDWHYKSVVHINCVDGWAAAGEYNRRVMEEWQDGFLDVDAMVMTEECRRGNVEGALHQRAYLLAIQHFGSTRKVRAGAAKTGSYQTLGTQARKKPTDTYCQYHALYFAATLDHSDATCRTAAAKKKKK